MGIVLMLGGLAVYIALCMVADRFLKDEKDRAYLRRMEDAEFKRQMRENNKSLKTRIVSLRAPRVRLRPPKI